MAPHREWRVELLCRYLTRKAMRTPGVEPGPLAGQVPLPPGGVTFRVTNPIGSRSRPFTRPGLAGGRNYLPYNDDSPAGSARIRAGWRAVVPPEQEVARSSRAGPTPERFPRFDFGRSGLSFTAPTPLATYPQSQPRP
jgi:hypothetical protein